MASRTVPQRGLSSVPDQQQHHKQRPEDEEGREQRQQRLCFDRSVCSRRIIRWSVLICQISASLRLSPEPAAHQPLSGPSRGMNNRQRQLLIVFSSSMGVGLLGGLAFNVTSQLIRPGTIQLEQDSSRENSKPMIKGPPAFDQNRPPSSSDCDVPPGGGASCYAGLRALLRAVGYPL